MKDQHAQKNLIGSFLILNDHINQKCRNDTDSTFISKFREPFLARYVRTKD